MKILVLEPFFGGSHQKWAEGYQKNSRHEVAILSLRGRHWKWRMHGGAVSLHQQLLALEAPPDLLLATDMLNVASFLGLARKQLAATPVAVYFHENQITYPWSPDDQDVSLQRDNQYGFMNYTTALAADAVFFNSPFHLRSFLDSLPAFLKQFPDARELQTIPEIADKSEVLPLGMDLQPLQNSPVLPLNEAPVILWNHRWEYDKNPGAFFELLYRLKSEGYDFRLIVLGESYRQVPAVFKQAREKLKNHILHWGYAEDKSTYLRLLHQADILPVTSVQDFFGGSVVEAIYCNCYPVLPRRLAYPMHIPAAEQGHHLYDTEEELYQKVARLIAGYPQSLRTKGFQHFVAHYDWSTLATKYDQAMERLLSPPS
jgi:glycosyltransferase involved in cell wall biosynthesis